MLPAVPMNRAAVVLVLASAVALAACGRKGDPGYPEGTPMREQTRSDGTTKKAPEKPKRGFVLDPLLN